MKHFDRGLNIVFALATIVAATVLLRREFRPAAEGGPPAGPPSKVANWESEIGKEDWFGNAGGPLKLVIFTDFECPFCRRFHENTLPLLLKAFPDSVAWHIAHYPLPNHRFALPAAKAYECSRRFARHERMVDLLYANQDSFGLKTWASIAAQAGVTDTLGFNACALSLTSESINKEADVATKLGILGTPGIMLNGWLFSSPPKDTTLVRTGRLLIANGGNLPDVKAPNSR